MAFCASLPDGRRIDAGLCTISSQSSCDSREGRGSDWKRQPRGTQVHRNDENPYPAKSPPLPPFCTRSPPPDAADVACPSLRVWCVRLSCALGRADIRRYRSSPPARRQLPESKPPDKPWSSCHWCPCCQPIAARAKDGDEPPP